MAERVGAHHCCAGCIHLQEEYIESGGNRLYKCSSQMRSGNVVGWVRKDNELKTMGGSCCNVLCPGDMFDFKGYFSKKTKRYLYCGKKENKRILLSIPDHVYTPVPDDYFRGHTGVLRKRNFQMVMQTKEQLEFHRRVAKRTMRKEHE